MKKIIALVLAFVLVMGLVACGGAPATNETNPPAGNDTTAPAGNDTTPPVDNTPVDSETPVRFTWHQAQGTAINRFESPYRDNQSYLPWVLWESLADATGMKLNYYKQAKEITANADFTVFTIEMAGHKWHDGETVDINDVLYSIQLSAKLGKQGNWKYVDGFLAYAAGEADTITGISVDDKGIMTIKLTQSVSAFLATLYGFIPLPEHQLSDSEWADYEKDSYWDKPVGNGPYVLNEVSFPDYCTVTRWDDYYGEKPGVKNLKFISFDVGGTTAAAVALATGTIDFADMMTMTTATDFDTVAASNPDIKILYEETNQFRGFAWNLNTRADGKNKKALLNAKARRAIAMMMDTAGIAEMMGGMTVTQLLMPMTMPEANKDIAFDTSMDSATAKAWLTEAGWDFANDTLDILYYYNDQLSKDVMDYITQTLGTIGVKVNAFLVTEDLANAIYGTSNFDLCYLAMTADETTNCNVYSQHLSGRSYTFLVDKESEEGIAIDAKYAPVYDAYISATGDKRQELADQLQEMAYEDCYLFALYLNVKAEGYNTKTVSLPEDAFARSWAGDKKWSEWKVLG